MLRDRRGYSTAWVAGFLAFVGIPILALALGVVRWAIAAAEVQEAADLAALAAVRDVQVRTWEAEGVLVFDPSAYGRAEAYANLNTDYLAQSGITVHVVGIAVDDASRTVGVRCRADLNPLFPAFLPDITVEREGTAQVRMWAWEP